MRAGDQQRADDHCGRFQSRAFFGQQSYSDYQACAQREY
jgi:hypothetical protein